MTDKPTPARLYVRIDAARTFDQYGHAELVARPCYIPDPNDLAPNGAAWPVIVSTMAEYASPPQPYVRDARGLAGLAVTALASRNDTPPRWFGASIGYPMRSHLDRRDIEAMHRTVSRIERRLSKMTDVRGWPADPGEYVVRFAEAIGADGFLTMHDADDPHGRSAGPRYRDASSARVHMDDALRALAASIETPA